MTGGQLDARTGSLVGPLACWAARQIVVDHFFCSCTALDPRAGATEVALEEAEVKRSIAITARRIVLAVDSSKLGHLAPAVCFELGQIDLLVTELDPSDARLDPFRSLTDVL